MTVFRTCTGCKYQPGPCGPRDVLKAAIKGLRITSVKWRCSARVPRFVPGDPVWAETVADKAPEFPEEVYRDDFPAIFVEARGSNGLVFIETAAPAREEEHVCFVAEKPGAFCSIPLARLKPRDAAKQRVCAYCSMPESLEHPEGYICAPPANARKWIGGEAAEVASKEGDERAISDRRTEA